MVTLLPTLPLPAPAAEEPYRPETRPDTAHPDNEGESTPAFSARLAQARNQRNVQKPVARAQRKVEDKAPESSENAPESASTSPSQDASNSGQTATATSTPDTKAAVATPAPASTPGPQVPPNAALVIPLPVVTPAATASVTTTTIPTLAAAIALPANTSPPPTATTPAQQAMDSHAAASAGTSGVAQLQTNAPTVPSSPVPSASATPVIAPNLPSVNKTSVAPVATVAAQPVTLPAAAIPAVTKSPVTNSTPAPTTPSALSATNVAGVNTTVTLTVPGTNLAKQTDTRPETQITPDANTPPQQPVTPLQSQTTTPQSGTATTPQNGTATSPTTKRNDVPVVSPTRAESKLVPAPDASATGTQSLKATAQVTIQTESIPTPQPGQIPAATTANLKPTALPVKAPESGVATPAETPTITVASTPQPVQRLHELERAFSLNAPATVRAVAAPWQDNSAVSVAATGASTTGEVAGNTPISGLSAFSVLLPGDLAAPLTISVNAVVLPPARPVETPGTTALSSDTTSKVTSAPTAISITLVNDAQGDSGAKTGDNSADDGPATAIPEAAVGSNATAPTETRNAFHTELTRAVGNSATVERAAILEQVAQHLDSMRLENGKGEVSLQLHPQQLGAVKITLQHQSDGVTARILAETPQAHQALDAAKSELRAALESKGFTVHSLEVSVGQGALGDRQTGTQQPLWNAQDQAEQNAYARALRAPRSNSAPMADITTAPTESVTPTRPWSQSASRLDYTA